MRRTIAALTFALDSALPLSARTTAPAAPPTLAEGTEAPDFLGESIRKVAGGK